MESRRDGPAVAHDYRARLAARRGAEAAAEQRHARLSAARLALLGVAVALLAWRGWAGVPWLALPALAFGVLAFVHARVLNTRDRAARAAAFYERGLARLEDRWAGTGETGDRFRDEAHPFADDLDLFGSGSLFQLLATPRTAEGEAVLAGWLRAERPATAVVIRERQAAVAELGPRLDLREDMAVLGPEVRRAVDTDALVRWAVAPPQLPQAWPRVVAPVLAAISTGLVIAWIVTGEPPAWLVPALAGQALFAWWFRHAVHEVAHGVEQREHELQVLATLLARIEREPLTSPRLAALEARLRASGRTPSAEIRRLARLVDVLSSGHNQIFAPIAALLLVGTQLAFAVDRWRARLGGTLPDWIAVLGEVEALAALAGYAGEHPGDAIPEIVEGAAVFEAEGLAHPLVPAARAVANDVRLGGEAPHVLLVSGSNMSGKSTLLRAVGINVVLALAGAPVRATRLRVSPLMVGATLRVQDSLQAGRSRFFAEITRLSAIVAMARAGTPATLFLLDEVLAGTNSHDRQLGAEAIVRGLVELGAIGLVTTHDLALTGIVEHLGARAANVHFEDRFADGVLHFDYRLRPGVVRTSNAIPLMRSVGLDV